MTRVLMLLTLVGLYAVMTNGCVAALDKKVSQTANAPAQQSPQSVTGLVNKTIGNMSDDY